jgi:hypothetical protein
MLGFRKHTHAHTHICVHTYMHTQWRSAALYMEFLKSPHPCGRSSQLVDFKEKDLAGSGNLSLVLILTEVLEAGFLFPPPDLTILIRSQLTGLHIFKIFCQTNLYVHGHN